MLRFFHMSDWASGPNERGITPPPNVYHAPRFAREASIGTSLGIHGSRSEVQASVRPRSNITGGLSSDPCGRAQFDVTANEHQSFKVGLHYEPSGHDAFNSADSSRYKPANVTDRYRAALYNLPDPRESVSYVDDEPRKFAAPDHPATSLRQLSFSGWQHGQLIRDSNMATAYTGRKSEEQTQNDSYSNTERKLFQFQKIDPADVAFNDVARMSHKQRRKTQEKQKEITVCVTCEHTHCTSSNILLNAISP